MPETDRERLERIKRETAYAAGPADGVYVTRRGKPLEITVKMADARTAGGGAHAD